MIDHLSFHNKNERVLRSVLLHSRPKQRESALFSQQRTRYQCQISPPTLFYGRRDKLQSTGKLVCCTSSIVCMIWNRASGSLRAVSDVAWVSRLKPKRAVQANILRMSVAILSRVALFPLHDSAEGKAWYNMAGWLYWLANSLRLLCPRNKSSL